ncbi:PAS domain-containing hybrid sensor histidine kinase/response regulator [Roseateles oligotrophus]|uniref:histidine kinase n=1 Tax=Roseateles oligotrophus TaxID=1769250 RepID=A0ABT2YCP1_9BURK|nr:PAS domain-containing hybrid sensor histidine kinase/response regulator [Roseateles oligotrophus]MCV2367804.1 response regulator [Roseateles oligotrophus]
MFGYAPHPSTWQLRRVLALLVFGLVGVPLLALAWLNYSQLYELTRANAIHSVGKVASERRTQMLSVLARATSRANNTLRDLIRQCGSADEGRDCFREGLRAFVANEQALGASLLVADGVLWAEGDMRQADVLADEARGAAFKADQLARFTPRVPGGSPSFYVLASEPAARLRLVVHYPLSLVQSIFVQHPELGNTGETFLADEKGFLITSSRYQAQQGHADEPISVLPMQRCLSLENGEMLELDYRATPVIHGFRFMPEIGAGCVMAHMDQAEAFAPIKQMRARALALALGLLAFALLAAWWVSRWVTAPIAAMTRKIAAAEAGTPAIGNGRQAYAEMNGLAVAYDALQAKLKQAHSENSALLAALDMHAIISTADRAGIITDANPAFCAISGYSREELIGQNHRIVKSGVQDGEFWDQMWHEIANGRPWRGEICNRAKGGRLYWVDTFIAPFVDAQGMISKYISIRIDITASKQAANDLRVSQERIAFALEGSGDGVWDWDVKTSHVQYSDRMKQMLGFEPSEIADDLSSWSNWVHPQDLPATWAAVTAHLDGHTSSYANEHRAICKDGSVIWVLARGLIVQRDAAGAPLRMVGTYSDITAKSKAEQALKAATEAAEAASTAKSQFLANMSHEIRTPMNAILGLLMLLRKTEMTAKQADYAAKTEGAARSLLGLINEILDFSKIEAGKMTLDPQPFGIDQLLRDLSVLLSASAGAKPVEVLYDIDASLPRQLVGDAMRLQQVLLNLGSNAIKFTPAGHVVLSIKVLQRSEVGVTVQFSMRDSGIGIAPENQARIFSGFSQAEANTTRRFGGTGLGVAISQRFVALMGGELELESALGEGSRFFFTITLPLASPEEAQVILQSRVANAQPDGQDGRSWRALVVDDNPLAREILAQMGESLGWRVDVAESGEAALAMLKSSAQAGVAYEAVFVDWQMPGLDGWQTSQQIQALSHAAAPPVIVMVTAHGREMLAQRSEVEQAQLDGFLVKPVTASMLFDAVIDARAGKFLTHPSGASLKVKSATPNKARLAGLRLLLVEDNLNNQQVAQELLQDEGASVQIANHGQEAIDALKAAGERPAFDVVLMDLQMPVMDGYTAARYIRSELALIDLPIVAMTANAMSSDREACLAAGMNDHVGKPFDLSDLVRVLLKQTGRADASQTVPAAEPLVEPALLLLAQASAVDLPTALHRLGGKQAIYMRMLKTFVHDLPGLQAQLGRDAEAGDIDAAKRALHTLKGLAATLGVDRLAAQAALCEKQLLSDPSASRLVLVAEQAALAMTQAEPSLNALVGSLQAATAQPSSEHDKGANSGADPAALLPILQALARQLRDSDMGATETLGNLQQGYGALLGERLGGLDEAVGALDFELALRDCEALIESLE